MVHYPDHIKNFGSPNGLCSSITESKHIAAVKRPWHRSNRYKALAQILKVNERLDKLAIARADFASCGMLADSPLVAAILDTMSNSTRGNCDNNNGGSGTNDGDDDDGNNGGSDDDNGGDGGNDNGGGGGGDDEDDDHGPVESPGPLMNEVRLARDKGTYFAHSIAPTSHQSSSPCP